MKVIVGLLLIVSSSIAMADNSWSCRNHNYEITCDENKCESSEGFTPMDVSFNSKGDMTICAYSGCWEGKGKVFKSKQFTMLSGHSLKFSTAKPGTMEADFVVAVDASDKVALIKGAGFAMPMTCGKLILSK